MIQKREQEEEKWKRRSDGIKPSNYSETRLRSTSPLRTWMWTTSTCLTETFDQIRCQSRNQTHTVHQKNAFSVKPHLWSKSKHRKQITSERKRVHQARGLSCSWEQPAREVGLQQAGGHPGGRASTRPRPTPEACLQIRWLWQRIPSLLGVCNDLLGFEYSPLWLPSPSKQNKFK